MIWRRAHRLAFWDAHRLVAVTGLALLPSLIVAISENGMSIFVPLAFATALGVFWPYVFSLLRGLPMGWEGILWAILFVLFLPGAIPLWQQGLALSFGIIMGELIFGGRGRGFLNPVTVGLAFLLFSFPDVTFQIPTFSLSLAAIGGGTLLLMAGILSWRIVIGFAVGFLAIGTFLPTFVLLASAQNASLLLGLVFLIGDPVAAASTNAGRWIYGMLAGALVLLLSTHVDASGIPAAVVFAALLSSIFAPLIDQIVIWANVRRRERRQSDG